MLAPDARLHFMPPGLSLRLLVTLQILNSSSLFSLMEETHGFPGQCVSFSLIDLDSVFLSFDKGMVPL